MWSKVSCLCRCGEKLWWINASVSRMKWHDHQTYETEFAHSSEPHLGLLGFPYFVLGFMWIRWVWLIPIIHEWITLLSQEQVLQLDSKMTPWLQSLLTGRGKINIITLASWGPNGRCNCSSDIWSFWRAFTTSVFGKTNVSGETDFIMTACWKTFTDGTHFSRHQSQLKDESAWRCSAFTMMFTSQEQNNLWMCEANIYIFLKMKRLLHSD